MEIKWSASRPGRFTPGGRAPGTHSIEHWVDPRADVDEVVKRRKIPAPTGNRTPVVQAFDFNNSLFISRRSSNCSG
jgi:hypothetical protein